MLIIEFELVLLVPWGQNIVQGQVSVDRELCVIYADIV